MYLANSFTMSKMQNKVNFEVELNWYEFRIFLLLDLLIGGCIPFLRVLMLCEIRPCLGFELRLPCPFTMMRIIIAPPQGERGSQKDDYR